MEGKKIHNEIDFWALGINILKEWKILSLFVGISIVLGIIVALSTPKSYTAQVILAPEMSSGGLGLTDNLADMASNFGIDLGSKTSVDAIYPELYPDVFASTDFILQLFDVPVRLKDDDTQRTYLQHLEQDMKMPFWDYPKAWIMASIQKPEPTGQAAGTKDPLKISKKNSEICASISKSITCLIDKKTSEITIGVTDQDPMVATIMADTLQKRLQKYITNYRTKKARIDLAHYQTLMRESRNAYEKAQHIYASYADANMDVSLESYKTKRDQLEDEMQMRYTVYTQMAAQVQQAQAKVQERTPAFTIIQNPYMPYRASSRPRIFTVIIFMFVGVLLDTVWILYARDLYKKRKMSMKKS